MYVSLHDVGSLVCVITYPLLDTYDLLICIDVGCMSTSKDYTPCVITITYNGV